MNNDQDNAVTAGATLTHSPLPARDAEPARVNGDPDSRAPLMELGPEEILAVRRGPGANCSSIGSALDMLYLSAVAAGAVLAGIAAAVGEHATKGTPAKTAQSERPGEPALRATEDGDAGPR